MENCLGAFAVRENFCARLQIAGNVELALFAPSGVPLTRVPKSAGINRKPQYMMKPREMNAWTAISLGGYAVEANFFAGHNIKAEIVQLNQVDFANSRTRWEIVFRVRKIYRDQIWCSIKGMNLGKVFK